MDDPAPSLRPALLTRTRLVIGSSLGVAVLLATVVLPRFLGWREDRRRAEIDATEAPYLAEAATLEAQLAKRLAPLITVDATQDATCPASVTGNIPLVQREWLAYAIHHDVAEYPKVPQLESPVFDYLAHSRTPSRGATDQLATRNRIYRELLASPYVAIHTQRKARPIEVTGEAQFAGGEIAGSLAVIDVAQRIALCRTPIVSRPDFIISVRQDSVAGDRWARASAEAGAIASSFWDAAQAAVARVAPGAKLVAN